MKGRAFGAALKGMSDFEFKKRGWKATNSFQYNNEEDYKALRGPVAPGDTYGIKMGAVNLMADTLLK
jgi:hypothetical protein